MTLPPRSYRVSSVISANCFIVVAGSADLSRDPGLIRRLWSPTYRAWFPEGKDDREATVIRVAVDRIDYWEPPSNRVVRVAQAVKRRSSHAGPSTLR